MTEIVKFNFRGDTLDVVRRGDDAFAVVKRVCEVLGVDLEGQRKKLRADESICTELISVQVHGDDQAREVFCIHVDSLPLWLATIHPTKVRPEVRAKLVAFKRECAKALADYFYGSRRQAPSIDDLLVRLQALLGLAETNPRLVHGAALRDNPYLAAPIQKRFFVLAKVREQSFQRVHGAFRKQFGIPSYLSTSVFDLPVVVAWFDAQLGGPLPSLPKNDGPQLKLFGAA